MLSVLNNNKESIWIGNPLEDDEGMFTIKAEGYSSADILGVYETEERAKEVLQEIIEKYESENVNDGERIYH